MGFVKYGLQWEDGTDPLKIEMYFIKNGGQWKGRSGNLLGQGLEYHYEQMRRILWPELDGDHNGQRWHTLCKNEIIKNKVTVLMGAASCGKTHEAAWFYLCDYYVFPTETCVLVSSTDLRGLELRVWGEIKSLHERATARFDYLPGILVESKHAIATDDVEEGEVRDLRRGIIGIPCIQGGKYVGLGKYSGIKQKRVRLLADEAQFMGSSFLSAIANLDKNEDFKAIILGNPNDILDSLGKAAEPLDGWTSHLEPTKTTVWNTRFLNGRCVNLIGTDSPNFDYPTDQPTRFKYLISKEKIQNTLSFFPKDSIEYYSQCVGVMKVGVLAKRVLTRDLCRQFGAQEDVIWKGTPTTKVYFVDASYGGDRCVAGWGEFGEDVSGKIVLSYHPPKIIPILIGTGKEPEYQIAEFVKEDCESLGIPASSMGHDSTGRGSLGTALAQVWSNQTNPIESGGSPTDRPVCLDLYIFDPKTNRKRLQLCSEYYDRKVTEFWFSVRYAVESGQIRNLPEEAMEELCTRQWENKNNKKSVEVKDGTSSKPGMKQRTGKSPDMGDWAAGIVEMARRQGFFISKLGGNDLESQNDQWGWFHEQQATLMAMRQRHALTHSH